MILGEDANCMAHFVSLYSFTGQGISNVLTAIAGAVSDDLIRQSVLVSRASTTNGRNVLQCDKLGGGKWVMR